jgi:hypothetical protein
LAGVGIEVAALSVLVIWPEAPLAVAGASLFVFGCAAPFFVMQAGTGALIDLVARMGGTAATGYRLVFLCVIVILVASAAVYRYQPEVPDEI